MTNTSDIAPGRTGAKACRPCPGTMAFGPQTSERDRDATTDRALELGIRFFATADVYGTHRDDRGHSDNASLVAGGAGFTERMAQE